MSTFLEFLIQNPPLEGETVFAEYCRRLAETKGGTEGAVKSSIKKWMKKLGKEGSLKGVREWLATNPHLTLTKQVLDKNGEVRFSTKAIRKEIPIPAMEGMKITKVTSTPFGGTYVSRVPDELAFLTEDFLQGLGRIWEKEVKPAKIKKTGKGKQFLKIFTADKHIGANVDKDSIYQNAYSKKEYKRRMGLLLDKIATLASGRRFAGVAYFDLGDALDGYNAKTTRGGHVLPQNLSSREQFDAFLEVEKWFIENLMQIVETDQLIYRATSQDNHAGAFGYTAYRSFEEFLKIKFPSCDTQVSNRFLDVVSIGGGPIVYTHGKDEEDKKHGLPLNIDNKSEIYLKQFIEYNDIKGRVKIIKGDLHQYNVNSCKNFDYINVPSLFGCSKWIMNNYGYSRAGAYLEVDDMAIPVWF